MASGESKQINSSVYQLIYSGSMSNQFGIFKKDVLRFPRLDTVLMIEDAIMKAKGDQKSRQIWLNLPKKVMWQTYVSTLDYLEYSGKIVVEQDKHVLWIWAPKEIQKLKDKRLVIQ